MIALTPQTELNKCHREASFEQMVKAAGKELLTGAKRQRSAEGFTTAWFNLWLFSFILTVKIKGGTGWLVNCQRWHVCSEIGTFERCLMIKVSFCGGIMAPALLACLEHLTLREWHHINKTEEKQKSIFAKFVSPYIIGVVLTPKTLILLYGCQVCFTDYLFKKTSAAEASAWNHRIITSSTTAALSNFMFFQI